MNLPTTLRFTGFPAPLPGPRSAAHLAVDATGETDAVTAFNVRPGAATLADQVGAILGPGLKQPFLTPAVTSCPSTLLALLIWASTTLLVGIDLASRTTVGFGIVTATLLGYNAAASAGWFHVRIAASERAGLARLFKFSAPAAAE
jgi:hypothetical protein